MIDAAPETKQKLKGAIDENESKVLKGKPIKTHTSFKHLIGFLEIAA